jgi:hypothetical protein
VKSDLAGAVPERSINVKVVFPVGTATDAPETTNGSPCGLSVRVIVGVLDPTANTEICPPE